MRELFDKFERVGFDKKGLVLLDTCFVFSMLTRNQKLLYGYDYALSSFTVDELLHVSHRLHKMKVPLRRFLKSQSVVVVETPVHPGEWEKERQFVDSVDKEILKVIPDASDAVLLAVAIKTKSNLLTKDKHDIFTVEAENFLRKYGIHVYKEMKDLKR